MKIQLYFIVFITNNALENIFKTFKIVNIGMRNILESNKLDANTLHEAIGEGERRWK